jgi:transcriptional regulator with XRE-family HTH domain
MFRKKSIDSRGAETLTVGDCLRRKREELGYSIKEIGIRLGIKVDYLESLENGEYENLPPQVYVRGFLKSYANFLGVDSNQATKIYNREVTFLERDFLKDNNPKKEKLRLRSFVVITPKLITLFFSLLIFSVLFYYLYHQINSFNSKPYLFLENPAGDAIVVENIFRVNGYTEKGAILKINGQEVVVDASGYFDQNIVLAEGRNILIIESKNRFNKLDKREINIIYEKPKEEDSVIQEVIEEDEIIDVNEEGTGKQLKVLSE